MLIIYTIKILIVHRSTPQLNFKILVIQEEFLEMMDHFSAQLG